MYDVELDNLIDKIVDVVKELKSDGVNPNITKVISRIREKNICDRTTARDAIIWAVCKKKLVIKKIPPNQLVLDVLEV